MSTRSSRLRAGSRVVVDLNHWPELLAEMAIVDADGMTLKGVSMEGTIQQCSRSHFNVYLDAVDKAVRFPNDKIRPLQESDKAKNYFVVMDGKIADIKGLHLPKDASVRGYHIERKEAESELQETLGESPDQTMLRSAAAPTSIAASQVPANTNK